MRIVARPVPPKISKRGRGRSRRMAGLRFRSASAIVGASRSRGLEPVLPEIDADVIRLEGKAEGKVEGKVETLREVVLRQGRKKFGEPEAAALQALQAVADMDRLERLSDALLDVPSWTELLAVP